MDGQRSGQNEARQEIFEQVDRLASQLETLESYGNQIFAARQGFYEKLIVLNGATLTLLLGAVPTITRAASPAVRSQLLQHVVPGCWLLVFSIILCFIHNHINIAFLVHATSSVRRALLHGGRVRFKDAMKRAGFVSSALEDLPAESPEAQAHLKKMNRTEKACMYIGALAQGLTVGAYVEFLWSMKRIVSGL